MKSRGVSKYMFISLDDHALLALDLLGVEPGVAHMSEITSRRESRAPRALDVVRGVSLP